MPRTILTRTLALIASISVHAQPLPKFDVVTIKPPAPSTDGRTHTRLSSDTDKGQANYLNVNLRQVIGKAYKVQSYQISGPDWIDTDRFDIVARFAPHSPPDEFPLMLQSLLADRFKLTLHRETRELPVYELTVMKNGPRFKSSPTEGGLTINSNRARSHIEAKITMQVLAELLSDDAGRPILDKTGLSGPYDFTLDWTPSDAPPSNDATAPPSVFTAVQEATRIETRTRPEPHRNPDRRSSRPGPD